MSTRTLLVDNYDSFTYNLFTLLAEVNGEPPTVVHNDVEWDSVPWSEFDNIVISPVRDAPNAPVISASAPGSSPKPDCPS